MNGVPSPWSHRIDDDAGSRADATASGALEPVPEFGVAVNQHANSAATLTSGGLGTEGSAGLQARRSSMLRRLGGKLGGSRRYEELDEPSQPALMECRCVVRQHGSTGWDGGGS